MLKDQIELLEEFNAKGVEYLVIGGHAVSAHGVPRMTKDLDVWVRNTPENGRAVFRALKSFGAPLRGVEEADFIAHPEMVFQVGVAPHRIDLLQSISGVEFGQAWERRVESSVDDNVRVSFISLDDLIRNKLESGRPRDLGDADELRKARETK
jgi:hypothetical protein